MGSLALEGSPSKGSYQPHDYSIRLRCRHGSPQAMELRSSKKKWLLLVELQPRKMREKQLRYASHPVLKAGRGAMARTAQPFVVEA